MTDYFDFSAASKEERLVYLNLETKRIEKYLKENGNNSNLKEYSILQLKTLQHWRELVKKPERKNLALIC